MNIFKGYLLSTLAGLSTLIGTLPIFFNFNKNKVISKSLYFASGVMITISTLDLIPESLFLLKKQFYLFPSIIILLIFIVIGIIISTLIDKINKFNNDLYRVGVVTMLAIIMHNIPEGIATFLSSNTSIYFVLFIAILCHNIPEGISISVPIYYSTNSKLKAFFYTFSSGISEVFGAILAHLFLINFDTSKIMSFLFALIAGIMIQISLFELIPSARKYNDKYSFIYLFLGIVFMIFTHILLK